MELTDRSTDRPARECPPDHTVYLSQMVADNAVTLHLFKAPHCTTIRAFPCGDHFHIGHTTKTGKMKCLAGETPMTRDTV